MTHVRLSGQLVCTNMSEVDCVTANLAAHIALTRAEPGCVAFHVAATADQYIWQVDEEFVDHAAFRAHQQRAAASEWGRVTSGIERKYVYRHTTPNSI